MKRLGVCFALFLASCGPEDALLDEAHEAVRSQLRDPGSAVFDDQLTHVDPAAGLVCMGKVNSRNGFGGMTGMQDYYYQRGVGAVLDEQGFEEWEPLSEKCTRSLERYTNEIYKKLGKEPPKDGDPLAAD